MSTTAELDIYRTANILVKEYGAEQAPLMAANAPMHFSTSETLKDSECGRP